MKAYLEQSGRFYGFYRGIVVDNDDQGVGDGRRYLGRCKVRVEHVYGSEVKDDELPWAWPAGIVCGKGDRGGEAFGLFVLPRKGAGVWVAFEFGDPRFPIWFPSWFSPKIQKEIGQHVIEDQRTGVRYPDIVALKGAKDKDDGCWLRIVDDQRIEMVHTEDDTFIELDAQNKKVKIHTEEWDVEVSTQKGNVEVSGNNVTVNAEESITLRAPTITIWGDNVSLLSEERTLVASKERINGSAPEAFGFMDHSYLLDRE